jgi:hypothetical protein
MASCRCDTHFCVSSCRHSRMNVLPLNDMGVPKIFWHNILCPYGELDYPIFSLRTSFAAIPSADNYRSQRMRIRLRLSSQTGQISIGNIFLYNKRLLFNTFQSFISTFRPHFRIQPEVCNCNPVTWDFCFYSFSRFLPKESGKTNIFASKWLSFSPYSFKGRCHDVQHRDRGVPLLIQRK